MTNATLAAITGIYWHKILTPEEREVDRNECPIFEVIDDMSKEEMAAVDRVFSYTPESLGHYNRKQREWFNFEDKHKGDKDLIDDILERKTHLRYKLWYIVSFPEKIEVRNKLNGLNAGDLKIAEDFLISVRYNQESRN